MQQACMRSRVSISRGVSRFVDTPGRRTGMLLFFVSMCSVACAASNRLSTGAPEFDFIFSPRLLLSLAAMADMEELAIVQYAGRPQPIMIRYMLDEAKGNNVNARTLKVWDCSLHR